MKKEDYFSDVFKSRKEQLSFTRRLVETLAEGALIGGQLDIKDFSDSKGMIKKLRKTLPKRDKDLFFKIIHTPSLLEEGEKFARTEDYDFSYIFYATYFEHFVNEIIDIWATRNSIPYEISSSLIRRVSLEDKYTWLLVVLKLPPFNHKYWKIIKNITDKRNNFIHYKYKSKATGDVSISEKVEWEKDHRSIFKAIKYTKFYRSKVVFDGKKKKFKVK